MQNNEVTIAVMQKDISQIRTDVGELKQEMRDFIKASRTKFAGKWTENVLIFIGTTVGIVLIGALLSLIIIK